MKQAIIKNTDTSSFINHSASYTKRLNAVMSAFDWTPVELLAHDLLDAWKEGRQLFICGNGGSAGNAIHIANDFLYGISKVEGSALRVHALPSNSAVLTCLANDTGYDNIYAHQLSVMANSGDILLVLSGSGNSANIVKAVETAKNYGVKTYGILGYSGGKTKDMVDVPIHFEIDDMQISEDLQIITAHMIMQWLYENRNIAMR